MKVLLVINPNSGRKSIAKSKLLIEEYFKKIDNAEIVIVHTKIDYNAEAIIKNYDLSDIDLIVFCGGDGTLNEGINGLMENEKKDVPVSFIPMGTMNDFAHTIKMPTNQFKIASVIKNGEELDIKTVDIGKIDDRYFCYVSAFGNFIDVGYVTSQKLKNVIGKLAYYLTVVKELLHIKSYKITLKGENVDITDEMLFGAISDSAYIAGLKWYDRERINLQDGLLDVLLIRKPKNIWGYFKIVKGYLKKQYTIENNYYHERLNSIEIISKDNFAWTIDGEYYGDKKEVKISNITKKVNFAIPKEK